MGGQRSFIATIGIQRRVLMSKYAEVTGYLIHQREFKNSSIILDFFSEKTGQLHLVAKGIKKNKKLNSQLSYFSLLKIQYFGKSSLKTIVSIDKLESLHLDDLICKTAGLYLNELLRFSLNDSECSRSLFALYASTLKKLGHEKLTPLLRKFEREILRYNGFELSVSNFNDHNQWLSIDASEGLLACDKDSEGCCQVADLSCFLNGEHLDRRTQKRINSLMIKAIDYNFSHRRIYARELLKSLTQP